MKTRLNIIRLLLWILILPAIQSCQTELEFETQHYDSRLVVDGWIERGGNPHVILTRSTPYFSKVDSTSFRDLVVTTAKVTVYGDSGSEVLTLTRDTSYFPPYVYKGFRLKGSTGSNYRLEIIIRDREYHASTSIPRPPKVNRVMFRREPSRDSLGKIMINFTDDAGERNYYHVLNKVRGKDKRFVSVYGSTFSDEQINGLTMDFPLYRRSENSPEQSSDIFYNLNDTVFVKFATIDSASYRFWRTYQFEKMNAVNPFASSARSVEGNISHGALGIWSGYNALQVRIIPKKMLP